MMEPIEGNAARASVPMGRLGTVEECVGAYVFLATDTLSSYVTGQIRGQRRSVNAMSNRGVKLV